MNTYLPGGNVRSGKKIAEVKHLIILDSDASFSGISDVENLQTWKTKIQTDLTCYVFRGLASYENNSDEPAVQTAPTSGRKLVTSYPPPSLKAMIDTNYYDYKELRAAFKGGTYSVVIVYKDGDMEIKHNADGTFSGFLADLTATKAGPPKPGEIATEFPVDVFFHDAAHFDDGMIIHPAWGVEDLLLAMPVGLYLRTEGTMSTGSITVIVEERDKSGYAGLVVADFEVVNSNHLTSPAVTVASDDGDGAYTLTVQKSVAPENLAAGDWVEMRVNKGGGSLTTHISNKVPIVGTGV